MMVKRKKTPIVSKMFYWLALAITLIGFANLFTQMGNYSIPFFSTILVPFLRRFTVSVDVWDASGRSDVVTAEHLAFFTCLLIALLFLIIGTRFNRK